MIMTKMNDLFLEILHEELIPAQGCTEPIAIAYAAAVATKHLGSKPSKIKIIASGNLLKNARNVIVPNSGNMAGVAVSAVLGALGGDADLKMQVLNPITDDNIKEAKRLLDTDYIDIELKETPIKLYIEAIVYDNEMNYVNVKIIHTHTNIIEVIKNEEVILANPCNDSDFNTSLTDRSELTVERIYDFANTVDLDKIDFINDQIQLNKSIAEEGLKNNYGIQVGKTIVRSSENNKLSYDMGRKAASWASAGSDARMSGSCMPVVINSGSGNQGMTISLPVISVAEDLEISDEKLLRALVLSNLIAIHLKTNIGRLSAFCGVVSAGTGASAGITYLQDGTLKQVEAAITHTLANIAGIFCDGAKSSCALKVYSCVDAGYIASLLALDNLAIASKTGIVERTIEETIQNVGMIGQHGMNEIDNLMVDIISKK